MGGSSLYRLLRVLTDAGIKLQSNCRPNIVGFLDVGFEDDDARRRWLLQAAFAVRVRNVQNPGGYIKTLADQHVHRILSPAERERFEEAVGQGFGRSRWDLPRPSGAQEPGGRRG